MPYQPVRNVSADDTARQQLDLSASARQVDRTAICPTDDEHKIPDSPPATLCPTDHENQIPSQKPKIDKRSYEYMWKSGVAGGLAACTVCSPSLSVQSALCPFPTKQHFRPRQSLARSTA